MQKASAGVQKADSGDASCNTQTELTDYIGIDERARMDGRGLWEQPLSMPSMASMKFL